MKVFNSLTRKVEEFEPLNSPKVGVYACGPTVYDYVHIGNLRSFTFYDVLHRLLRENGYQTTFVQNITDIEDKIIKRSSEKGITPQELTEEYTKYFFQALNALNILPADVNPKATEHITKMTKYIETLIEKGLAYVEQDGSVYFDISKFPEYGKLSQVESRELKTGTRVLSDEYSKEDVQDFALWKSVGADEYGFDSPWGKGRPGWHIECSVMSQEYLGDTFDLHLGGIDLLFPHHENEIAQAEGKTGQSFVKYFVHGEHILSEGKKMSKSLGNYFTLEDVVEKGFNPLAFRYLVLTAHYRDKLNFTWESLTAAANALNNLYNDVQFWDQPTEVDQDSWNKFLESLNNDVNSAQALAVMWEVVHSSLPTGVKAATLLKMDSILGLGLENYVSKPIEIPEQVQELVDQREKSRQKRDFSKSDDLRNQIKQFGFEVEDTPQGPRIKKI